MPRWSNMNGYTPRQSSCKARYGGSIPPTASRFFPGQVMKGLDRGLPSVTNDGLSHSNPNLAVALTTPMGASGAPSELGHAAVTHPRSATGAFCAG